MNTTSRIVVLLLALQVASTVFLWTLDTLNQISEEIFALFVGIDLVGFAMISYTYRTGKRGESPRKGWMLVGCVLILVLIFSSLFVY